MSACPDEFLNLRERYRFLWGYTESVYEYDFKLDIARVDHSPADCDRLLLWRKKMDGFRVQAFFGKVSYQSGCALVLHARVHA